MFRRIVWLLPAHMREVNLSTIPIIVWLECWQVGCNVSPLTPHRQKCIYALPYALRFTTVFMYGLIPKF